MIDGVTATVKGMQGHSEEGIIHTNEKHPFLLDYPQKGLFHTLSKETKMYHDFWLLAEGVHSHADYMNFASRNDAPVRLHDDLLQYFEDTLAWIPSSNPAMSGGRGLGLNWYGPTIITHEGGLPFQHIWTLWGQIFACGPKQLTLRGPFEWQWPEGESLLRADQLHQLAGHYERLEVDRDWLIATLTTLAGFGKQVATGKYFILHLGI